MDARFFRPDRLEADYNEEQWKHWLQTFSNFIEELSKQEENPDQLKLLVNYISASVYSHISECDTYEKAIKTLKAVYEKPTNEIYARHRLATRRQLQGESIDTYVQQLKLLTAPCSFKAVSAEKNRDDAVRDAFIAGLSSSVIRQRLLENKTLTLEEAVNQARSLDLAQRNADMYAVPVNASAATEKCEPESELADSNRYQSQYQPVSVPVSETAAVAKAGVRAMCQFCGRAGHPRSACPARNVTCFKCSKKGHFAIVCRSSVGRPVTGPGHMQGSASATTLSSMTAASAHPVGCSTLPVEVNSVALNALVDSGSTSSFLSPDAVQKLGIQLISSRENIAMASSPLVATTLGHCLCQLKVQEQTYSNVKLSVLPHLCADVILGQDFMELHQSVQFDLKGTLPPLKLCGFASMNISPPRCSAI